MSLALKYRPVQLGDMVGQEHVVIVLRAILKKYFAGQSLPAGFLFAGSKGTGKTTSARIVAAILNCQSEFVGDPRYAIDPCAACENCRSVQKSNCLFVHEIDAASAGLVDDVRKIKEIASLSHVGNVRVIILDEAHSLSRQAFEALLKQLEEPMANVLYIFCTTEPEQFPETILSRLMVFTFKQLVPEVITARLKGIAEAEGIQLADGRVLSAIAVKAQGAMRDGITMMEQLSNYKAHLSLEDFLDYYGLVGSEISLSLIDMAQKGDIARAKKLIETHFRRTVDVAYFLDSFMQTVTETLHNKQLTSDQVVEMYKAAVEVKSRLKFMSGFVAANFLFALLLRIFAYQGEIGSATVSVDKLTEIFA